VEVQAENQTLATITLQNFFRLYVKLSGMTGTAMTEAAEFNQIYNLGVVPIPTNRDMVRLDNADLVYRTEESKYNAVVDDIVERHALGQPILVGTTSVAKSEHLSKLLKQNGVPHEVLNAKHHEREAAIVAQAGRRGAVTVATNMAGRGTDIVLGGNAEFMADAALSQRGLSPAETPDDYEAAWPDELTKQKSAVAAEHEEVVGLGGLYVLATERHESRRIDNQLRGRSGRQGDPGESQFYLSLEDDLMRLFKSDMVDAFLRRFNVPDDVPIEAKMVTNAIRSAQTQVEAQNFEIRKDVLKYDDVLNRQRLVIYDERRRVLEGEDIEEQVRSFITDTVKDYVHVATADGYPESWDLDQLWSALKQLYPVGVTIEQLEDASGGAREGMSSDFLSTELVDDAQAAYDKREEDLGDEVTRELERRVILSVLDRKWREHLYEMDYLRDGIGLRAMAQRDPLIEYQREGFDLFTAMMDAIKEETVGYLFNLEVQVNPPVSEEAAAAVEELTDATSSGAAAMLAAAVSAGAKEAEASAKAESSAKAEGGAPAIMAKGLGPTRPQHMEYSAPSESGGVMRGEMESDDDGIVELDPNASRAERRRAERANRKRR
jgi:preprotein translocase subunit SecA